MEDNKIRNSSEPPPRIEDYGLIGDMHTCALVGKNGSIDFLCWPTFDSPSIFARILDTTNGSTGYWRIKPRLPSTSYICKQNYRSSTNILQTKFIHENGVLDLTDFFAVSADDERRRQSLGGPLLVRKVECVRGRMPIDIEISPKPGYAARGSAPYRCEQATTYQEVDTMHQRLVGSVSIDQPAGDHEHPDPWFEILFRYGAHRPRNHNVFSTTALGKDPLHASLELIEDQQIYMVMRQANQTPYDVLSIVNLERETSLFWQNWVRPCSYRGRFQQEVERSMLILKLLTYEPTGAIVAAPTFSLPEAIGGGRQWDYRYSWVRDSSFTVYVFLKMGFSKEAEAYINFIFKCIARWIQGTTSSALADTQTASSETITGDQPADHLPLMFSIDGEADLPELELEHFGGYLDSKPVRIGNAATGHIQLDIYGELMDAVYLYNKHGKPLSFQQWLVIRHLTDFVCTLTNCPDNSIWEVRGPRQNFTYSKIMLWVALDRALRLAEKRPNFPCPNRAHWRSKKDILYEEIMTKGFNYDMNTFVQSYESNTSLDSSVLIAPLVFFIDPNDPQFIGTLEAIMRTPQNGGLTTAGFVYRYDTSKMDDGVGGKEGAFLMCTLWLIEALARAGRYDRKYLEKATSMFEQVTNFRNHLGMLSEEIATSGEQLGNTPQAFSHLAYVSAAIHLERVRGEFGL